MYPRNLKYSETHEWVKIDKDVATIGITDFAVKQLTDIAYVELSSPGERVIKGSSFGVIETVKAVSDLYSPVNGKIVRVNENLQKEPDILAEDPYGRGWMIMVEIENISELDNLMDSERYQQLVKKER